MKRVLLAIAGLLALAVLGLAWAVWRTFPRESGWVQARGHAAHVRIETDGRGVPTIRAQSIPDAFFGLGYVHAKDRLWQMEFQRRVAAGRLSEILGAGSLPADRLLRTVGFRRAAESAWRSLPDQQKRLLEAYAAGVNAFLAADGARPIELRILRVAPEPWQPVDSLGWAKMMAWDLAGNARDEIRRARFAAAVGPEKAAELLPLAASEPTILADGEWPPAAPLAISRSRPATPGPWSSLDRAFASLDPLGLGAGEDLGSNSWVLAGSRTATGRPILANDPHLGLRAPSVWYLASLDAPGLRAVGATLPGVPGVIIGRNDRIAWGLTSLEPDVQDLFVEEVDPRDASRYRHRGEWRSFERRTETIRVRGGPDEALTVRGSVHGPIVTGVLTGAEALGPAVALRWTGLDEGDNTAAAFFAINTARNWSEFLAGVRQLRSPPQNFVYADVEGHIGYTASGAMPIRPRADGMLPVSGAGDDDWTGTIPVESLPSVVDPPRGFLVTANNRVMPAAAYPYPFGLTWAEPYRAQRILELIESNPRAAPGDVAAMQLDRRSLQARELLPLLLRGTAPADAASRDALQRLARWDGEMAPESVPAAIYAAWFVELAKMPEDELAGVPRGRTRSRFLINALRGETAWCDDVRTAQVESCAGFKAAALKRAVAFLAQRLGSDPDGWRWERLHRAKMPHGVFGDVRVLKRLFNLEIGQGGDASTVNVGAYSQDGAFAMTDGASYRQVIDLGQPLESRFIQTTGQSGNAFSTRYRDFLKPWRAGELFAIGREPSVRTLVLEPR